jgi:Arc/MetJ-type ribon-helix-helix transcriptional regulator
MTITLSHDQTAWLSALVAAGRFASVDAAAGAIIAERMALETDDLDWAKPLLDKAREGVANGDVVPFADVQKQLAERIKRLSVG